MRVFVCSSSVMSVVACLSANSDVCIVSKYIELVLLLIYSIPNDEPYDSDNRYISHFLFTFRLLFHYVASVSVRDYPTDFGVPTILFFNYCQHLQLQITQAPQTP